MENQNKIKATVFSALFVGIIAVVSQFYIPFVIPLTFQVFAICLCGYMQGAKWGTASVLVYLLAGVAGIPVFSGFKGGFSVLFEATGGFLIGFLPLVFLCGTADSQKNKSFKIIISVIGLIICHLWGIIQFSLITKQSFTVSLLSVSLPYIIKDILLMYFANTISKHLKGRF